MPWASWSRFPTRSSLSLMISFITSGPMVRNGTTVQRALSAGLKCCTRAGFTPAVSSATSGGTGVEHIRVMTSVPRLLVRTMIVFLKSMSRPVPSVRVPLSNTW